MKHSVYHISECFNKMSVANFLNKSNNIQLELQKSINFFKLCTIFILGFNFFLILLLFFYVEAFNTHLNGLQCVIQQQELELVARTLEKKVTIVTFSELFNFWFGPYVSIEQATGSILFFSTLSFFFFWPVIAKSLWSVGLISIPSKSFFFSPTNAFFAFPKALLLNHPMQFQTNAEGFFQLCVLHDSKWVHLHFYQHEMAAKYFSRMSQAHFPIPDWDEVGFAALNTIIF